MIFKENAATKVFTLDESNKIQPTNVQGRAAVGHPDFQF